jgi:putative transposase
MGPCIAAVGKGGDDAGAAWYSSFIPVKKGALGLEDHGRLPPELQRRVQEEVEHTRRRSGWPAKKTLAALGIAARSYYRWLEAEGRSAESSAPVSPYEALSEEKQAVLAYARKHPELRHRELAWRMVDEDVAYLSASTVYRILKAADLVCPWRRRARRKKAREERASRPDQRWSTDLMHVQVGGRVYYFVASLDEYSRSIVHHELLSGMDGLTVSLAAQKAIEMLPKGPDGKPTATPEIRSDNGSCYVSKEFRTVLRENGLGHHRIRPHGPEENGLIERANRTLREALDGEELTDLLTAGRVLARLVRRYNEERLHSALGYLPPWEFYRGEPSRRFEARRIKLSQARHRRRERNLQLRQGTLPLEGGRLLLPTEAGLCHHG